MISYKVDSTVDSPVVITVTGESEYKANCRKHNNVWYILDQQCMLINRRWYYLGENKIAFDNELKKLNLITKMIKGIIEIDEDNLPVLDYFSSNPCYNVQVMTRLGSYICKDYRILEEVGFIENPSSGMWYDPKVMTLRQVTAMINREQEGGFKDKGYNIEDNADEYVTKKTVYDSFSPKIDKRTRKFAKFIGDITWGTELEFARGNMPPYLQHQLGIVMCRDGSTSSGGEAVTIPYKGAKGLQTMKNLGKVATARLESDLSCSLHIHIGSINLSRTSLAALWKLAEKIQDELFTMFPYYKTNPEGIKQKNYNKKLKPLFRTYTKGALFQNYGVYVNNAYSQMFKYLSEGSMPSYKCNRKQAIHPVKNKWDRPSRYHWLNFQNAIFSTRKTVEFRLHHATLNSQKMINWLFICNAIVKYSERHANDILLQDKSITLDQVLEYYTDAFPTSILAKELVDYLKAYCSSRKAEMKKDYSARDFSGSRELKEDKEYVFTHNSLTDLF